jgi:hypothetical protein
MTILGPEDDEQIATQILLAVTVLISIFVVFFIATLILWN